jgi:peroxiredoxin
MSNNKVVLVPSVVFKARVRIEGPSPDEPYTWFDLNTFDLFADKRVVLFSLPGAFTPTCSAMQLPNFEKLYADFKKYGIDEIYCVSVNDAFVMNAWKEAQNIKNVKLIPDGSGHFTRQMGMSVSKDNLGFGMRSWRYAVIVDNGLIEKWFIEPGFADDAEDDPYGETSPENILQYLKFN